MNISHVSVVQDVVVEDNETLEQVLSGLTVDTDITTKVLHERGSGGGWPEVEFTGPRADLMTMLNDSFGLDWSEMDDFVPAVPAKDVRDAILTDAMAYKTGDLSYQELEHRVMFLLELLED